MTNNPSIIIEYSCEYYFRSVCNFSWHQLCSLAWKQHRKLWIVVFCVFSYKSRIASYVNCIRDNRSSLNNRWPSILNNILKNFGYEYTCVYLNRSPLAETGFRLFWTFQMFANSVAFNQSKFYLVFYARMSKSNLGCRIQIQNHYHPEHDGAPMTLNRAFSFQA